VPTLAVVSRSLDFDVVPLCRDRQPVTVFTTANADDNRKAALAEHAPVVVAGAESVDLRRALDELGQRGASIVLCEGGPTLFDELADLALIDEVCLTFAPALGGDQPPTPAAPLRALQHFTLQHAVMLEQNAFIRWTRRS
jgi:riboflavin biosynthesis pyrimidine reductase